MTTHNQTNDEKKNVSFVIAHQLTSGLHSPAGQNRSIRVGPNSRFRIEYGRLLTNTIWPTGSEEAKMLTHIGPTYHLIHTHAM